MGIRDIYYSIEEKYYKALDKINEFIPVYAVVDPIDKIIPTFLLLCIIAVLAVAGIAIMLIPPIHTGSSQLVIIVKDADNKPVYNAKVDISGPTFNQRDLYTDNSGRLVFDVPTGETLEITARKNLYTPDTKSIMIESAEQTLQLTLKKEELPPEPVTIQFISPSGSKLQGTKINVHIECTSGNVQPGQKALDIGSGSGWTTALLAYLVGPKGKVMGLEIVPELVGTGQANIENLYSVILENNRTRIAPMSEIRQARREVVGLPEEAPYDRILVSAAARRVPKELIGQLKPDGVMIIPVGEEGKVQRIVRVHRKLDGEVETEEYPGFAFVPLR